MTLRYELPAIKLNPSVESFDMNCSKRSFLFIVDKYRVDFNSWFLKQARCRETQIPRLESLIAVLPREIKVREALKGRKMYICLNDSVFNWSNDYVNNTDHIGNQYYKLGIFMFTLWLIQSLRQTSKPNTAAVPCLIHQYVRSRLTASLLALHNFSICQAPVCSIPVL